MQEGGVMTMIDPLEEALVVIRQYHKDLRYYIARARVWKQAAKDWRQWAHVYQATADRRLALLREIEWFPLYDDFVCPICHQSKSKGHYPDCRLAKELSDASTND